MSRENVFGMLAPEADAVAFRVATPRELPIGAAEDVFTARGERDVGIAGEPSLLAFEPPPISASGAERST